MQTHLESRLLEKMAKFGSDFLETLLLPVYLICKRTHTKEKGKIHRQKVSLEHGFEMEMCQQYASDCRKQKHKKIQIARTHSSLRPSSLLTETFRGVKT